MVKNTSSKNHWSLGRQRRLASFLPELAAPLADSFVGYVDATFEQQVLDVTVAVAEPIIGPDAVANDFSGKAVILVPLRVSGRGHPWLPICLPYD